MFLFQMTVTINYLETDPKKIDLLFQNVDQTFQSFSKPLGYKIVWGKSKLRTPRQSMDQSVTESDSFLIERTFLQYRNVQASVTIFSGIVSLLRSLGEIEITYKVGKDKIVVE